ncbi:MAG: sporulation protein, partial [Clostridiales bacterium]|nr:sporulation protein [Clostridiales bacterium]
VGMSQWGAYNMAKQGKKASEIIHHYFKDIEIVKMWP